MTEAMIVSTSMGRMVLRSTTSASMPSFSSSCAAFSAYVMPIPKDTMVTSLPSRWIRALPIGIVKSSSLGTGKVWP
jgi:hypothetical protein